jgi:hypothetical protein
LVHFHYTPTNASWLNQVEGFFGILGKQSLSVTDFPSTQSPAQSDHRLPARVEKESDTFRMDKTGRRDYPVAPSDA